ncbi:heme ABC transporter ATP-binding protein [Chitinophaga pendula]|uniref:heme ABC transporter ATP-binding protein n=1 Tax=Chitinophaga TaxID=79328 RepID=UPI000BB0C9F7|nr:MULTISPECIES: heme ABC transporter ATP-binding protein [Chitinophaga]ASZ09732.1 heme ABC transporter ATP-binding protein [Chitinophaga sp. MD30]UCJ07325.1 heme ABC transporter ATP-binding protein [Chitinophaga pendula]
MLQVDNISLSLGHMPILRQVSFDAPAGELCVLMGANGAGKSTLLKTLAGEYSHYKGTIRFNKKALKDIPVEGQATMRAVLSQQQSLTLPFTVTEVVRMGRFVYGYQAASLDQEIIDYALKTLQVYDLRHRSFLTLSGGQKQRVQMARVLAQLLEAPDIDAVDYAGRKMLLLDEPVTGMDILHQQIALQLSSQLAARGVLVVAVLHDFQLAAAYAQRIVLLHQGHVYADGNVAKVLTADNIESCFGIAVSVLQHPLCEYPLIVTAGNGTHHYSSAQEAIKIV